MTFLSRLLWCLTALVLASSPGLAGDVAVLHSAARSDVRTTGLDLGLTHGLPDASVRSIFLGGQNQDDDYFEDRFEEIQRNWGDTAPAVVVADGETAFAFVRKYREELFAASPVIYCGMPAPDPEYLRQCGECTGLPEVADLPATLALLFALRPQTRLVVGIMDGSSESLRLRRAAEQAMEPYLDRARMLFPGHEPGDNAGLTMEKLARVAASVPRAGVVLHLGFGVDAAGRSVDQGRAVSLLTGKSTGPVVAVTDRWMDQGVAVAQTVPGPDLGAGLAGLARRIMAGEPAGEMLPEPLRPRPVADLTVLARFGVPATALPPDTLTLNTPSRPEETTGAAPAGLAAAAATAVFLAGLYGVVRRRAGRRGSSPGSRS
jgi:hypothetical protein